jgi:uncharacterized protein (TIRG00374 family)
LAADPDISPPEYPSSPEELSRNRRGSPWVMIFSLALASLLLYLTLRELDWNTFWNTVRGGHYEILLLTIPISSLNYFIRAFRWNVFLSSGRKIPLVSVFWANMVGYMGNAYLPARAGELLRSVFLGKSSGLGASFVLATALTERLMDVVALVLFGSIFMLFQFSLSPLLVSAVYAMALVGFIGLVVIIAAPTQEKLILKVLGRLPLPEKISHVISEQVSNFLVGMRSLRNGHRLQTFIFLTCIIWLIDGVANVIGVRIISGSLNLGQSLFLLAALGLSSAIPSTPGYVGVYQFVAVNVLVPFGFSQADALAYILISQIINYVVVTFWGLIGVWKIRREKPIDAISVE